MRVRIITLDAIVWLLVYLLQDEETKYNSDWSRPPGGDHLSAIIKSNRYDLVGVVDTDINIAKEIGDRYSVGYSDSIDSLLKKIQVKPDIAVVAIPHCEYLAAIDTLARERINIIKEKPFAISEEEAIKIINIVKQSGISLFVTLQRRFNPFFQAFRNDINKLGCVYAIEAEYAMNIARLDNGWRGSKKQSGGGALADMGYHYIDLLIWYFGLPNMVMCETSTGNREGQTYDVEDTAFLEFMYSTSPTAAIGDLVVSRTWPSKEEHIVAHCRRGSVAIHQRKLEELDIDGNETDSLLLTDREKSLAMINQLNTFADRIISGEYRGKVEDDYLRQVAFLETSYKSAQSGLPENPYEMFNKLKEVAGG